MYNLFFLVYALVLLATYDIRVIRKGEKWSINHVNKLIYLWYTSNNTKTYHILSIKTDWISTQPSRVSIRYT